MQIKSSSGAFAWIYTVFMAHIQKNFQRFTAFFVQALDSGGIKIRSPIQADKFTPKELDVWIILDNCFVTVNNHNIVHGFTP